MLATVWKSSENVLFLTLTNLIYFVLYFRKMLPLSLYPWYTCLNINISSFHLFFSLFFTLTYAISKYMMSLIATFCCIIADFALNFCLYKFSWNSKKSNVWGKSGFNSNDAFPGVEASLLVSWSQTAKNSNSQFQLCPPSGEGGAKFVVPNFSSVVWTARPGQHGWRRAWRPMTEHFMAR